MFRPIPPASKEMVTKTIVLGKGTVMAMTWKSILFDVGCKPWSDKIIKERIWETAQSDGEKVVTVVTSIQTLAQDSGKFIELSKPIIRLAAYVDKGQGVPAWSWANMEGEEEARYSHFGEAFLVSLVERAEGRPCDKCLVTVRCTLSFPGGPCVAVELDPSETVSMTVGCFPSTPTPEQWDLITLPLLESLRLRDVFAKVRLSSESPQAPVKKEEHKP